jgi:hypothetical protein
MLRPSTKTPHVATLVTLVTLLAGCAKDAPPASKPPTKPSASGAATKAKAKATKPTKSTSAIPAAKAVPIGRWPAAVRADYETLRALGDSDGPKVIKGVLALARRGAAAGPALAALHDDDARAARVRTMAGVMFANLHRFAPETLGRLLRSSQVHVVRHAALLLSQLGGTALTLLRKEAERTTDPMIAATLRRHAGATTGKAVPPRTLALLHQLLASTSAAKKQWAGTELAVSHIAHAEPFLLRMLHEAVADPQTRLQASLALVEGHAKDIKKLRELASRRHPTRLRLAACQQLAKLGAPGKKALSELARAPNEPLAAQIKPLLK